MKIYFLNGKKSGEEYELKPPGISIGRETDNDISLLEEGISRYHAKLECTDSSWTIEDLGSTNGVKINGKKTTGKHVLKNGDDIKIGNQQLRFGGKDGEGGIAPVKELPVDDSKDPGVVFNQPEIKLSEHSVPSVSPEKENENIFSDILDDEKKKEEQGFIDSFKGTDETTTLSDDLTEQSASLFGKIDIFGGKSDKAGTGESGASKRSRKHASVLFYVAVIGAAVIFVSLFLILAGTDASKDGNGNTRKNTKKKEPLLVVYEKQISTPDNIFRYTLKIENGFATVTLDDLKYQRRYKAVKEVPKENLDSLLEEIKDTQFMVLQKPSPGVSSDGTDESRSLIVGYDGKLNSISVKNTFAPSSFEEIESAIEDFSTDFLGVRSLVLTAEEMRSEAEKAYRKAEDLFMNYDARPENLKEAVKRYQITLDLLDQFSPKPDIWDIARKKMREAETIKKNLLKAHGFNAEQALRLKDYVKARDEYGIITKMTDPDEKVHGQAKKYKDKLDNQLMKINRKSRKR